MNRTLGWVCLITILAAVPLAGAQSPDIGTAESVRSKLNRQAEYLGGQSYRRLVPEVVDKISAGQHKRFSIQLITGVANAIIATCGTNCDHVQIELYDYQRKLLARSPEKRDTVIINGNPQYSGLHEVEIAVPGCHTSECEVGLLVLRQEPVSNIAPRENYKRYDNRDLWGGDIATLKNVDLENKCSSACNDNKQCRAYSFDKWRYVCYLKSEIGGLALTLDPTSVAGVRSDVPAPPQSTTAITIKHYPGRAFPGTGYKAIKATQLQTCEATCKNENSCIAYTFQKNDRLCRLFDTASEFMSESDSDSGGKMQKPPPALNKEDPSREQKSSAGGAPNPDSPAKGIRIISGVYGAGVSHTIKVTTIIGRVCNGKTACKFPVSNEFFGRDPIFGTKKQVTINWNCGPDRTSVFLEYTMANLSCR